MGCHMGGQGDAPGKGSGGCDNTSLPLSLFLRLEGPHHHHSDTAWPAQPNHHAEPRGHRSSPVRGARLPGTALQLTGESLWGDRGLRLQCWAAGSNWLADSAGAGLVGRPDAPPLSEFVASLLWLGFGFCFLIEV